MEGMQSRAGNESGLVVDPEVLHRLKGIGENNSLSNTYQTT